MPTLTQVSVEHQERLMTHVERLRELADSIGSVPDAKLSQDVSDEHAFLVGTLIPHMETVEKAVHPELDRLLSCRLAMAPMEREHVEVRRLIEQLGEIGSRLRLGVRTEGDSVELNRALLRLYSILKVHLREESLYVPILEHNLEPEQAEALAVAMEHAVRVEL